ncbi:hypothetical protein DITRI_Ditri15bG0054200 [Diplodiscus trichospermus]
MATKTKRIVTINSPSFAAFTGNSFPFSVPQLPKMCFLSSCSISAVDGDGNVNIGMSKTTHLEKLVIDLCPLFGLSTICLEHSPSLSTIQLLFPCPNR